PAVLSSASKHGRHRAVKRREFISLLGGAAAWPLGARAQQPGTVRRIGALIALAENDSEGKAWVAGFRQGLEKRGWSEDRNLRIEYRFAPAGAQAQVLAQELVALQPEVIFAIPTPAVAALHGDPAALAARLRPYLFDRLPESERAIGDRELGANR